jgi:hypothetical protein
MTMIFSALLQCEYLIFLSFSAERLTIFFELV